MKLPPELRNRVYGLLLVDDNRIQLNHRPHKQDVKAWKRTKFRAPGLFLTSKQIREEAMSVYYQVNNFKLSCTATKLPEAVKMLKEISKRCGKLSPDNVVIAAHVYRDHARIIVRAVNEVAQFVQDSGVDGFTRKSLADLFQLRGHSRCGIWVARSVDDFYRSMVDDGSKAPQQLERLTTEAAY